MAANRSSCGSGAHLKLALLISAIIQVIFTQIAQGNPQLGASRPIATEQTAPSLSDKHFAKSIIWLKDDGDVFFGSGGTEWGHWEAASGTKTRLLQVNDPMPGYPGSVLKYLGIYPQGNAADHLAMITSWAAEGARNPAGIFVYDGAQFKKVVRTGEAVPGVPGGVFTEFTELRFNANDQVAFVAKYEPAGPDMLGVFLGSPTSAPIQIATVTDLEPLMNGPDNIYLIGVDNAGNVAFLCEDFGNPFNYSLVVASPTGVISVIKSGDPAPDTSGGNFFLSSTRSNYVMNSSGDLAFWASVWGDPAVNAGIWVRNLAGSVQKLAAVGDATGTSLEGTYGYLTLRGFNNNGQVLYSGNLNSSATTNQALFMKTLATGAQVICYRNQTFSGDQQIDTVANTFLGNDGKAVVLTTLKNPYGRVLMFDPPTSPEVIAQEGSATPLGGAYGQILGFRMNSSHQVVFRSDITSLNANGLFLWTSGSPMQPIVNTTETVPAGANRALFDFGTIASDDEVLFWGFTGEGKDTIFTKSLRPGDNTIRRVIGDGDPAPGGGVISYIFSPAMNDKEEMVIYSSIIGGTRYPGAALWLSKPGNALQKLVETGDPAPGSALGMISGFPSQPRINNGSEVAFYANISGSSSGSSNAGIFLVSSSGTVHKIARVGDPSPAGGTFTSIYNTVYLSDLGTVAFRATSQVSSTQQLDGYFVGSATADPVKVMAVGDSWEGDTFSGIKYSFRMNSAGQVAFWAGLSIGDGGIFIANPGSPPVAVVIADDESPNPGAVIELEFPDAFMELNNSGQVAFWGVYWVDQATFTFGTGYFRGSAGTTPTLVVSSDQALPGGGTAPVFVPVANALALADSGELAMYIPGVSGAADLPRYIIADTDGTLRQFASVGALAPGTAGEFGRLGSVTVNSAGKFLINAMIVNGSAKQGIFLHTPPQLVDFNADHISDTFLYNSTTGQWSEYLGNGSGFDNVANGNWSPDWTVLAADLNGDGVSDLFLYNAAYGYWYKAIGDGLGGFAYYPGQWSPGWDVHIADLNGDGLSDIFLYHPVMGMWYRCISPANPADGFAYSYGYWTPGWSVYTVDWDGDAKTDLFVYSETTGSWCKVTNMDPDPSVWSYAFGSWMPGWEVYPGDFNGDGQTDFFLYLAATGTWYVALNSSGGFTYTLGYWSPGWSIHTGDFNGDNVTDLFVYSPITGGWYKCISDNAGGFGYYPGIWSPVWEVHAGDYDKDGIADVLLYYPDTGAWYLCITPPESPGSFSYTQGTWSPDMSIIIRGPNAP